MPSTLSRSRVSYARSASRDGEPVRNEGADVYAAIRDEIEKRAHVLALGPAHVRQRIIASVLLVFRIVAARSVAARDDEGQLFLVQRASRKIEPDGTHRDDATFVSGDLGRECRRPAARAGRGDEHQIGAEVASPGGDARGCVGR